MKKFFLLIVFSIYAHCLASDSMKFKDIVKKNRYSVDDSAHVFHQKKENILSLFTGHVGSDMYELQQVLQKN